MNFLSDLMEVQVQPNNYLSKSMQLKYNLPEGQACVNRTCLSAILRVLGKRTGGMVGSEQQW